MNAAFRSRGDRVEAEQRAGRHDDLAAVRFRQLDQVRPRQQRPGAEHHDGLAGLEHGPADAFEHCGRGAFDRQIGMGRKSLQFDQRTGDPLGVEPGLRLGAVARGRAGQGEPRHAVGELAGEHAPDGAEPGNGDAGR